MEGSGNDGGPPLVCGGRDGKEGEGLKDPPEVGAGEGVSGTMGAGTAPGEIGMPLPLPIESITAGPLTGSPGVIGIPTWAEAVAASRASERTIKVLMAEPPDVAQNLAQARTLHN